MHPVDGKRIQVVPSFPPTPFNHHQTGIFQNPEMLHHGAAIHLRQGFAQMAGGLRTVLQKVENVSAGPMAERLEKRVILIVC